MLDTYIKNRGSTKTLIHENHHNKVNEISWDADYDGNVANVSLDLNNNGKVNHYNVQLDNKDLANILNMNSINMPIDKRLKNDFKRHGTGRTPGVMLKHHPHQSSFYDIYLDDLNTDDTDLMPMFDKSEAQPFLQEIEAAPKYNYLSTPKFDEELIIPLSLNSKGKTHKNRNNKPKTHKTYKVYKRHKNTKSKAKTKSKRRKSNINMLKEYLSI